MADRLAALDDVCECGHRFGEHSKGMTRCYAFAHPQTERLCDCLKFIERQPEDVMSELIQDAREELIALFSHTNTAGWCKESLSSVRFCNHPACFIDVVLANPDMALRALGGKRDPGGRTTLHYGLGLRHDMWWLPSKEQD